MRSLETRENNTSGYTGVTRKGKHWHAQIRINGKIKHLGTFLTPQEAHEKYQEELLDPHTIQMRKTYRITTNYQQKDYRTPDSYGLDWLADNPEEALRLAKKYGWKLR